MKKRASILAALCLTVSLTVSGPMAVVADAAEAVETDLTGQLAFAQCEEYINIRSSASTEGEVTAKIYNNGAVTILGQEGDWYQVKSGNAVGYVKAEYFATGERAEQIAEEIAYNVAKVHPEYLNIRTGPSEDCSLVTVAEQSDELEVVAYDGDWMKVALGNDVYGYVNAYYVAYETYYPVAETLEEEQARLQAEREAAETAWADVQEETQAEDTWTETEAPAEDSWTDESWSDAGSDSWAETEAPAEDSWSETGSDSWAETEAPAEDSWTDESWSDAGSDTWTETESPVQTEAPAEDTWTETEAPVQTEAPAEDTWTETEAPVQTEAPAEDTWIETEAPTETEAPSYSSTGSDIANYAVQFVGNPYAWGGTSLTNGADCSGFVQSVFANFGIGLSRTAASQASGGVAVSLDSLQAGDLVFYSHGGGIDHVALYIGGGQVVHAANSNSGIIISNCYYNTPVSASRYW